MPSLNKTVESRSFSREPVKKAKTPLIHLSVDFINKCWYYFSKAYVSEPDPGYRKESNCSFFVTPCWLCLCQKPQVMESSQSDIKLPVKFWNPLREFYHSGTTLPIMADSQFWYLFLSLAHYWWGTGHYLSRGGGGGGAGANKGWVTIFYPEV